jgi:DNA mismatch endonuclease (patch repair protein)
MNKKREPHVRLGGGTSAPYPIATSPAASRVMRGNTRRDTRPEIALRRALFGQGLRFRVDYPIRLPSRVVRPDIVFVRARMAIFVDGCFWHGCPIHGTQPRHNSNYWLPKLARNRQRDLQTQTALQNEGWRVLRFWEHEEAQAAAAIVIGAIRSLARG